MKKTILVVDDFASIRDFVCDTLQSKGYETLGAANGNQAYEVLTEKPRGQSRCLRTTTCPIVQALNC